MINIAIIEDCKNDYEYLLNGLNEFSKENQEQLFIKHYESALHFLEEYKLNFDIIFMDIQLADIDGLMASQKLRMRDHDVKLIFVTNFAHLAIRGYSVDATDFLVKPVNYYKLKSLLAKLIKDIKIKSTDYVIISTTRGIERARLSNILYIEAEAHRITYHLSNKKISFSGTLSACEKTLPQDSFVRCYQSYIVNIRYIDSIVNSNLILKDGTTIPISRLKKKDVLQRLANYFGTGGR